MPIGGGLDIHRKQITFDYLDTATGGVQRGQIAPADRVHLAAWKYEAFPEAVGRLRAELGPDASAADGIEAFVARAGLAPGPTRRARQALHAIIEAESADLAQRQSLRWMWNEIEYDGDYFGDVPDGGYRRLVDAIATGVDLRLGRRRGRGCAVCQWRAGARC